ncbi:MAG: folate-binding protein, partial [Pelagibacteraceae bacterium]|nr:folate-binding protein [Pelagibacteraceae bacterium]
MTVPYFYKNSNSRFLSIEGEDSPEFLQNLITNDINKCTKDNFLYSCLLTPQGKFISDFFIFRNDENYLIEIHSFFYKKLLKKLNLYKLRSKVLINEMNRFYSYSVFGDL